MLFLPQVIPLVAAGIIWGWLLSLNGLINQVLTAIGLGDVTRAWLGDFDLALPAVGLIGTWVLLGLCTVLLLTGHEQDRHRAVRVGAHRRRRLVPGVPVHHRAEPALRDRRLRHGHGHRRAGRVRHRLRLDRRRTRATPRRCPGIQIYILAFLERQVGLASALAVVLVVLVLIVILPIQRLTPGERTVSVARREVYAGRALLVALIAITILPFLSLFTTALHPSGSVPLGLSLAGRPAVGQLPRGLQGREHERAPGVERVHRAGGRPDLARHLDDGGLRDRLAPDPGRAACCCSCSCSG